MTLTQIKQKEPTKTTKRGSNTAGVLGSSCTLLLPGSSIRVATFPAGVMSSSRSFLLNNQQQGRDIATQPTSVVLRLNEVATQR